MDNQLNMYDKRNTIDTYLEVGRMISIRLTEELEKQLKEVAKFEGKNVSDYVRQLICEKLEDIYDTKTAEKAYKEFIDDSKKSLEFDEVFDR